MSRRVNAWLAGAGVAIAVQILSLLIASVFIDGGADYLALWIAGSILGVLVLGAVFAIAVGVPPARIGFIAAGVGANLIWFLAAFGVGAIALVGVISVAAVIAVSRRVDWRPVSA